MNWWSSADGRQTVAPARWPEVALPVARSEDAHPLRVEVERLHLTRAELDQERAAASREGYAAGHRAGVEEGRRALAQAQALQTNAEDERAAVRRWLDQAAERMRTEALRLAEELAQTTLQRELKKPGKQALQEARRLLEQGGAVSRVKVNEAVAAEVERGLAKDGRSIAVEADATLPSADVVAETDAGLLRGGPTWRWQRLLDELNREVDTHVRADG